MALTWNNAAFNAGYYGDAQIAVNTTTSASIVHLRGSVTGRPGAAAFATGTPPAQQMDLPTFATHGAAVRVRVDASGNVFLLPWQQTGNEPITVDLDGLSYPTT